MDTKEKKKFFRLKLIIISLTMISGTWSTLTASYLDTLGFSFTLFQIILMFGGELLVGLLIVLISSFKSKKNSEKNSISPMNCFKNIGKKGFCLSAFFDFLSSIFIVTSIVYLPAFGLMSFKIVLLIFMGIYRKFFLKRNFYRHQFLGLGLIFIGIFLVTIQFGLVEDIENHYEFFKGMILMISGQVFLLLDIICMEYFMNSCNTQVEHVLLIKGSAGVIISLLSYVPMHYIFETNSSHSDLLRAIEFINTHKKTAIFIMILLISLGIFNYFFIKTLKTTDSLAICTVDCGRMILVWIFSYVVFIGEDFFILEIFAAVFMALGLMIYNEVMILPCGGFDKSAFKTLRENNTFKEMRNNSRTWQTQLDSLVIRN
jgi:uncharacterized membrane protein